jgi:hypothetical protein
VTAVTLVHTDWDVLVLHITGKQPSNVTGAGGLPDPLAAAELPSLHPILDPST